MPTAPRLVRRAGLKTERKRKEGGSGRDLCPSKATSAKPRAILPLKIKHSVFPLVPWIETNRRQSSTPQDCHAFRTARGEQSYRDSSPSVTVAQPVWGPASLLYPLIQWQGARQQTTLRHTHTPDGEVWVTEPSRASLQKQSGWVAIGARRTEL